MFELCKRHPCTMAKLLKIALVAANKNSTDINAELKAQLSYAIMVYYQNSKIVNREQYIVY